MKLFKALLCRAITVRTQNEYEALVDDIYWHYTHNKIKEDEREILTRLLGRVLPLIRTNISTQNGLGLDKQPPAGR